MISGMLINRYDGRSMVDFPELLQLVIEEERTLKGEASSLTAKGTVVTRGIFGGTPDPLEYRRYAIEKAIEIGRNGGLSLTQAESGGYDVLKKADEILTWLEKEA